MKTVLAIMLLASSTVFAVLPPLAQSEREIQAILSSKDGYELLGGQDPIEQILKMPNGYMVITSKKKMQVDVTYMKTKRVGPGEFKLNFHQPEELE